MLFLAGMSGNMQIRMTVINDLRALMEKLVNDAADRRFISGNGRGGNNHAVARCDLDLFVLRESHPIQCGHALALAAGGDDHDLVFGELIDMLDIGHDILRNIHIAQHSGNPEDVFHAPTRDRYLTVVFGRNRDDLLKTMHVRGKGCDDDSLIAAGEKLIKALPDLAFGIRVS